MAIRSGLFKQELFKTDSDGDKTRTSWWTSTETVDIDEEMDNEETALVDATSWDTTYDTASTQPTKLTDFISKITTFFKNVKFLKNRVDTMNTSLQQGIDSANTNANGRVSKTGDTMSGDLLFADSSTTTRQIRGVVGTNDYWRVAGGATAANGGWMEIATADDGNEPIYARQYTGVYSNPTRTAIILGNNGQTEFPVSVSAPTIYEGNQALSNKYQAKGNYVTTTVADNTYLKKTDAYKKTETWSRTEADYRYNYDATVGQGQGVSTGAVGAGATKSIVSFTLEPGVWLIIGTTSWSSGVIAENGKGVGHCIATTNNAKSSNLNTPSATVCLPYNAYNNTRVINSTIIHVGTRGTYYLVAYNRSGSTLTVDEGNVGRVRLRSL